MKYSCSAAALLLTMLLFSACAQDIGQSRGPDAQTNQNVNPPIIDMHMHADLDLGRLPAGTPVGCIPQPCTSPLTGGALIGDAAFAGTLEAMNRYNIVKVFLSGDNLNTVHKWVAAGGDRCGHRGHPLGQVSYRGAEERYLLQQCSSVSAA